uniref:Uncharacterized protein n=1 Tax=Arundo donax TaxID=35708 RepID=A0A0A9A2J8_ARUDO
MDRNENLICFSITRENTNHRRPSYLIAAVDYSRGVVYLITHDDYLRAANC